MYICINASYLHVKYDLLVSYLESFFLKKKEVRIKTDQRGSSNIILQITKKKTFITMSKFPEKENCLHFFLISINSKMIFDKKKKAIWCGNLP